MDAVKDKLKKWWPTIVTVTTALVTFITPAVQAYIGSHPDKSIVLAAAWGIVLHVLTSPKDADLKN